MTRFVPVTVLVLLAASRVASAETSGMLPSTTNIAFEKREIIDDSNQAGDFVEPLLDSTQLRHYFNLAHCNCAKPHNGDSTYKGTGTFNYLIHLMGSSGLSGSHPGVLYAGTSCNDLTHLPGGSAPSCKELSEQPFDDIDNDLFASGGSNQNFNLYEVAIANQPSTSTNTECPQADSNGNSIYVLVDTKNAGGRDFDYASWQPVGTLTGDTTTNGAFDTKPPPLPTSIRAAGSDEGIHVSWDPPDSNNTDIERYQVLCATLDDQPARSRSNDAQYVTSASLGCDASLDPAPQKTELPVGDGEMAVDAPTGEFAALDEKYVCGEVISGTSQSLDISGLSNGTPYKLILLSVDFHGNYTATYLSSTVTPIPSTDFWEDIHGRGAKVEGGLCLLAETYGDDSGLTGALRAFRDDTLARSQVGRWLSRAYYATLGRLGGLVHGSIAARVVAAIVLAPLVGLALAWHWLTLPGLAGLLALLWLWRRHRRGLARWWPRLAATAGIALIALASRAAHAGGGYQPYWENSNIKPEDQQVAPDDPSLVTWHAGLRVGPYLPDVDSKLGLSPGPFNQMFGGSRPMPMLDVDRILWTGFGQAGVGISLGYMQWFGHTFASESTPSDDPRMRSPADTNTFRLIPLALTGIYRFTWFDDEYGVPVVPYVRAGLAYDIWWLSARNSKVCKNGVSADDPACELDKPRGASLGWTASIGLAIRAERIDASTAMSMQQSGIQHAGVYAELSIANVDGFGSDTKLSVGDRTWFAGVDFEF